MTVVGSCGRRHLSRGLEASEGEGVAEGVARVQGGAWARACPWKWVMVGLGHPEGTVGPSGPTASGDCMSLLVLSLFEKPRAFGTLGTLNYLSLWTGVWGGAGRQSVCGSSLRADYCGVSRTWGHLSSSLSGLVAPAALGGGRVS